MTDTGDHSLMGTGQIEDFSNAVIPVGKQNELTGQENILWFIDLIDTSTSIQRLVSTFVDALNTQVEEWQKTLPPEVAASVRVTRTTFNKKVENLHSPRPLAEVPTLTEDEFWARIAGGSMIYMATGKLLKSIQKYREHSPNEIIHLYFVLITDAWERLSPAEWVNKKAVQVIDPETQKSHVEYMTPTAETIYRLKQEPNVYTAFVLKNYGSPEDGERLRNDLGFDRVDHIYMEAEAIEEAISSQTNEANNFMRTGTVE